MRRQTLWRPREHSHIFMFYILIYSKKDALAWCGSKH